MECREIESWIDPYLDRELADADARALEQHLSHCSACRGRYGALIRLLSPDRGVKVPETLLNRIIGAATTGTATTSATIRAGDAVSQNRHSPRFSRIALAASVALIVTGGLLLRFPATRPSAEPLPPMPASPWLACGLPQMITLPGPGGAVAAVMHAELTEHSARRFAEGPGVLVRSRSSRAEPRPLEPAPLPPVWEWSILARLQNL